MRPVSRPLCNCARAVDVFVRFCHQCLGNHSPFRKPASVRSDQAARCVAIMSAGPARDVTEVPTIAENLFS